MYGEGVGVRMGGWVGIGRYIYRLLLVGRYGDG